MKTLEGMLLYVNVNKARDCYEKSKGQEWTASVCVDEETADAWEEIFKKQPAKKVKRSAFEEYYKVVPPEGDSKNLYVITLKRNTKYKNRDGEIVEVPEKYRPKVMIRNEDGSLEDVTATILPANGSYGMLSVDRLDTETYGSSARLKNVLVTELIEYEQREPQEEGSEFAGVAAVTKKLGSVSAEDRTSLPAEKKQETKPTTKKPAKKIEVVEEEPEDDPF